MRLDRVNMGSQPLQNRENSVHSATAMNRSALQAINEHNKELQEDAINKSEVKTVLSKLNDFLEPIHTNLKFEFHEKLEEYYVTVVNPLTDEVIKEIPPKKMLDMYAAMAEFMGLLVDEKV
ncbi:flagellar protein FlaG [Virgibacillus oceani]|uniref:Flagellar protein FlaG n=1 Tax=Virgibacillus oceani TaxID=1479511 RepID=A0A917H4G6_9BACI|nr:flagellar protein FlaG [Virgibacillus oceani]GGG67345.1 hypothetical protein GCM10011398_08850 [Virgibacillus oceani]